MGKEEKLFEKIGRSHGMKVPEGYFDDFSRKMMDNLPAYPEAPRPRPLTTWQRVKPYVYMAAMFAGIWCMMKMFHIASQSAQMNADAMPESVALAIQNPEARDYYEYVAGDDMGDFEIESEVSGNYASVEDFEKDFGYEILPEYDNLKVS